MNNKKLFIVSLIILTILTIGAVSAADDGLATSDEITVDDSSVAVSTASAESDIYETNGDIVADYQSDSISNVTVDDDNTKDEIIRSSPAKDNLLLDDDDDPGAVNDDDEGDDDEDYLDDISVSITNEYDVTDQDAVIVSIFVPDVEEGEDGIEGYFVVCLDDDDEIFLGPFNHTITPDDYGTDVTFTASDLEITEAANYWVRVFYVSDLAEPLIDNDEEDGYNMIFDGDCIARDYTQFYVIVPPDGRISIFDTSAIYTVYCPPGSEGTVTLTLRDEEDVETSFTQEIEDADDENQLYWDLDYMGLNTIDAAGNYEVTITLENGTLICEDDIRIMDPIEIPEVSYINSTDYDHATLVALIKIPSELDDDLEELIDGTVIIQIDDETVFEKTLSEFVEGESPDDPFWVYPKIHWSDELDTSVKLYYVLNNQLDIDLEPGTYDVTVKLDLDGWDEVSSTEEVRLVESNVVIDEDIGASIEIFDQEDILNDNEVRIIAITVTGDKSGRVNLAVEGCPEWECPLDELENEGDIYYINSGFDIESGEHEVVVSYVLNDDRSVSNSAILNFIVYPRIFICGNGGEDIVNYFADEDSAIHIYPKGDDVSTIRIVVTIGDEVVLDSTIDDLGLSPKINDWGETYYTVGPANFNKKLEFGHYEPVVAYYYSDAYELSTEDGELSFIDIIGMVHVADIEDDETPVLAVCSDRDGQIGVYIRQYTEDGDQELEPKYFEVEKHGFIMPTIDQLGLDEGQYHIDVAYADDEWIFGNDLIVVNSSEYFVLYGCDWLYTEESVVYVWCPDDAEGIISLTNNDGTINVDHEITDEDKGKYVEFTLEELGISGPGWYEISVRVNGNEIDHIGFDVPSPIYMPNYNVYLPEEGYEPDYSMIIAKLELNSELEGNITINLDGTIVFNKDIEDMEAIKDGSKWIYTIYTSDLDEAEEGMHDVTVTFNDLNEERSIEFLNRTTESDGNLSIIMLGGTYCINWNDVIAEVIAPTNYNGRLVLRLQGEIMQSWDELHWVNWDNYNDTHNIYYIYVDNLDKMCIENPGEYTVSLEYYSDREDENPSLQNSEEYRFVRDEEPSGDFEWEVYHWADYEDENSLLVTVRYNDNIVDGRIEINIEDPNGITLTDSRDVGEGYEDTWLVSDLGIQEYGVYTISAKHILGDDEEIIFENEPVYVTKIQIRGEEEVYVDDPLFVLAIYHAGDRTTVYLNGAGIEGRRLPNGGPLVWYLSDLYINEPGEYDCTIQLFDEDDNLFAQTEYYLNVIEGDDGYRLIKNLDWDYFTSSTPVAALYCPEGSVGDISIDIYAPDDNDDDYRSRDIVNTILDSIGSEDVGGFKIWTLGDLGINEGGWNYGFVLNDADGDTITDENGENCEFGFGAVLYHGIGIAIWDQNPVALDNEWLVDIYSPLDNDGDVILMIGDEVYFSDTLQNLAMYQYDEDIEQGCAHFHFGANSFNRTIETGHYEEVIVYYDGFDGYSTDSTAFDCPTVLDFGKPMNFDWSVKGAYYEYYDNNVINVWYNEEINGGQIKIIARAENGTEYESVKDYNDNRNNEWTITDFGISEIGKYNLTLIYINEGDEEIVRDDKVLQVLTFDPRFANWVTVDHPYDVLAIYQATEEIRVYVNGEGPYEGIKMPNDGPLSWDLEALGISAAGEYEILVESYDGEGNLLSSFEDVLYVSDEMNPNEYRVEYANDWDFYSLDSPVFGLYCPEGSEGPITIEVYGPDDNDALLNTINDNIESGDIGTIKSWTVGELITNLNGWDYRFVISDANGIIKNGNDEDIGEFNRGINFHDSIDYISINEWSYLDDEWFIDIFAYTGNDGDVAVEFDGATVYNGRLSDLLFFQSDEDMQRGIAHYHIPVSYLSNEGNPIEAGLYLNIIVKYYGDDGYNTTGYTLQSYIDENGFDWANVRLSVGDDPNTIILTLTNSHWEPLADKEVYISVNGGERQWGLTDEYGIAIFTIDGGNCTVRGEYENAENQWSAYEMTLCVFGEPIYPNATIRLEFVDGEVIVTLTDGDGAPLANKGLGLAIDGIVVIGPSTDDYGIYRMGIEGNATVEISYQDENGIVVSSSITIVNNTETETVYVGPNATIRLEIVDDNVIASLSDGDGAPIANEFIDVSVNGVPVNGAMTNASGLYSISVEGNATVEVSYTDDNGITVSSSIRIINNIETVPEPVNVLPNATIGLSKDGDSVVISLKDGSGAAIAGASVNVSVNGGDVTLVGPTDADGKASVEISGNATVVASYVDNNGITVSSSIVINSETVPEPVNVLPNATISLSKEGNSVVISLKDGSGAAIVGASVNVSLNGGDVTLVGPTDADGKTSVEISGNATVVASYVDNNGITVSSSIIITNNTEIVVIEKSHTADALFNVIIQEDKLGVWLYNNNEEELANKNITVVFDDDEEGQNYLTDGQGYTSIPIGDHSIIKLSYTDEDGASVFYTVHLFETGEVVDADYVVIYITPLDDSSLEVSVSVNGEDLEEGEITYYLGEDAEGITVDLEDGVYVINYDNTVNQTIAVEYIDDDDVSWYAYYEVVVYNNTVTETVYLSPNATISLSKSGNDVLVSLTDNDGKAIANADLDVLVNGAKSTAKTNAKGEATIAINGNATVVVSYKDANNITVTSSITVVNETETVVIEKNNTIIEYVNQTVPPNATVSLSLVDGKVVAEVTDGDGVPLANKLLAVTVNGAPKLGAETDANGIYSIPVEGNATVVVSCTDNNGVTVSSSITVLNNSETVVVEKNNTIVEYVNQTVYVPVVSNSSFDIVGDENGISAILLDEDGKPISGAVVELDVNGAKSNITSDKNGEIVIPTDKNGTITMTYTDENGAKLIYTTKVITQTEIIYQNQTIEVPVYINVTPNRASTKVIYNNMSTTSVNSNVDGRIGEYFKVQLVDSNGKALANKTVYIGFNGRVYVRQTNETGGAQLQINLGYQGDYTFAIAFLGDDDYNGSFEVAIIKVSKQSAKLTTAAKTYKTSAKTKALSSTFKSAKGNAISGKKISFTVNGKTYTGTTDSKGVATVKVSLSKKGTYSFTAKFAGDGMYKETSVSSKLTLK
ncbi:hypothetical protein [Methanobrevibacter ruminantium]|nr:hypothetical protein [Methanobrevibacter ruminantium]